MPYKPFDPILHSENDRTTKDVALRVFAHLPGITENPDPYGVDLLYLGGSIECERKLTWPGGRFPFTTIQVPYRKKKYFDDGALYFLLAANNKDYCIIRPTAFREESKTVVKNKYVEKGEIFYQIPLYDAEFGTL